MYITNVIYKFKVIKFFFCRYGLIVRENSKPKPLAFEVSRNVFGSDADSDDDKGTKPVLLQPSANINRQVTPVIKYLKP